MMTKAKLPAVLILLPLLQAAPVVVAEDAPFTYSDDWGLVSAPPPPGPYQAVNIDPRVPGQDALPPMTTDAESLQGGTLGRTPLVGPAGTVYVPVPGSVSIGVPKSSMV